MHMSYISFSMIRIILLCRCDMVKTTHANEKDELTDILKDHDIKPNPISKSMDAWHVSILVM